MNYVVQAILNNTRMHWAFTPARNAQDAIHSITHNDSELEEPLRVREILGVYREVPKRQYTQP